MKLTNEEKYEIA